MARVFIDGFETGEWSMWDNASGSISIQNSGTYGMRGEKCIKLDGGGNYLGRTLPGAAAYWFAGKFRLDNNASHRLLTFKSGGTILGRLKLTSGKIDFHKGDYAGLMTTGTATINAYTTYHIQIYYKPATDGSGRCTVKINGVTDIDFTGQTATNALQLTMFQLEGDTSSYWDDIVIDDADFPGITHIQGLTVAAAGNDATQFTPTSEANYTCVDEVPPSDADYVYSNTAGAFEAYKVNNLSGTPASVKTVQVCVRACYTGAPASTQIKAMFPSGSNLYASNAQALSTAFKTYSFLRETNPLSSPWTVGEMQGGNFQVGMQI